MPGIDCGFCPWNARPGTFLAFDPATCSQVLGGTFSPPPSPSSSHSPMQPSPINRLKQAGSSYARLTDFPRHNRSPTTEVARAAADWQPRPSFCPTVGTLICLALCLRHSGTVIEQEESAACGFVSWLNALYHPLALAVAGSPSDKELQAWETRHKTQPGVHPLVTCMTSRWVAGWHSRD